MIDYIVDCLFNFAARSVKPADNISYHKLGQKPRTGPEA